MINVITTYNCSSCKKLLEHFKKNNIPFVDYNVSSTTIPHSIVKELLSISPNGYSDIVSKKSHYIVSHKIDLENMRYDDFIELVVQHPTVLKRPLSYEINKEEGYSRILVGYNKEDVEIFSRNRDAKIHGEGCDCSNHE